MQQIELLCLVNMTYELSTEILPLSVNSAEKIKVNMKLCEVYNEKKNNECIISSYTYSKLIYTEVSFFSSKIVVNIKQINYK